MQKPEKIILQTVEPAAPGEPARKITLSDMFNRFATGQTNKAILRNDPAISPETVVLARAFLTATDPQAAKRADSIASKSNDFKILVDENITPKVVKLLQPSFGHIVSVQKAGLKGKQDAEIWQWAVDNHCDAILTSDTRRKDTDNDLTLIAENAGRTIISSARALGIDRQALPELPALIHYVGIGGNRERALEKIFDQFEHRIKTRLTTMTRPHFEIKQEKMIDGQTYTKLMQNIPRSPRMNSWEETWSSRIENQMPNHPTATERNNIRAMVRLAAQFRNQSPGPAAAP